MIGLVVVSHSRLLADGVAELAGQMAPDVRIVASGGDGSGGLGTDYLAVAEAISAADSGDGVAVLFDLGSAKMVAEMAAEESSGPVSVVDAPLVEGAVAAAVTAQGGAGLDQVTAAARSAIEQYAAAPAGAVGKLSGSLPESFGAAGAAGTAAGELSGRVPDSSGAVGAAGGVTGASTEDAVRAEIPLTNEVGLHARPAALVVRSLIGLDARVVVRFGDQEADGASVLGLMGLGAPGGVKVEVVATGPDAAEAVRRVSALAAREFDE